MHKKNVSETGSFNPRIFLAFLLCAAGSWLAALSFASSPSSGTISDDPNVGPGSLSYTAGPFFVSNPTPVLLVDSGPRCSTQNPCDSYLLTTNITAAFLAANPNASVKVTASWTDTGADTSDYDMHIFNGNVGNLSGNKPGDFSASSSANPETTAIFPLTAGAQQYTVKIVPYTASGEVVTVRAILQDGAASSGGGGGGGVSFGGPTPTSPGAPRYQNFYAPRGSSAEPSTGEFNIGFNRFTGRIMTMNSGPIWRLTPPELLAQAKPECCEALWEDRSFVLTDTGTDPILFTDQKTGRTIAVNNLSSPLVNYAYTDNDGDTWNPVGGGPPNGADHETIGTGPLPADLSYLTTPLNQGEYVIFCSQTLIGANCQRSFDLGTTYTTPVVATGPGAANSQGCGGLHGHVRIASDGTAYLPDGSCGDKQGGSLTVDGGTMPWTEFVVEKTTSDPDGAAFTTSKQANGADPSVGIDKDNTVYYCYVNNQAGGTEGHPHVAVGKRSTDPLTPTAINWIRDTDVGAALGIKNAAHTEAIAGDAGRASCGFMATNVAGNYQSGSFPGIWYVFIATTYDEGRNWTTVNATPNDPVQSMTGIWQQGGSGDQGDRNLLDFNEVTMDNSGRVLYGYSDGCTSEACIAGGKSNLGAAMRVARQSGGKTLLAQFDLVEPVAPKAACLSGTRDPLASHLTWKAPDNGGADITGYQILRSTTPGSEAVIEANTGNTKTTYNDATADPNVATYYYTVKAITSAAPSGGDSSNEIALVVAPLPPVESICSVSGVTKLTDASGDNTGSIAGEDLRSFQIAQPYNGAGETRLRFTINTDANPAGTLTPTHYWYVSLKFLDSTGQTAYRAVRMLAGATGPTYEYYTPGPRSDGTVDGRFVTAGSNQPADAGSYGGPNGGIVIEVLASKLGLSVGSGIDGFVSGVVAPVNGVVVSGAALTDQMPNSLAYTGPYTVVANDTACAPPTPTPTATPTPTPTATPTPTPTATPTPTPSPTATPKGKGGGKGSPTPTPSPTATTTPTPKRK